MSDSPEYSAAEASRVALFWFHAFRRSEVAGVISVLREGPTPAPAHVKTDTRDLEARLGIPLPGCVYAYLGRTLEAFGDAAIALPGAAVRGQVSPFDTGGTVNKIRPLVDWSDLERQSYLTDYTWSVSDIDKLLAVYPTEVAARLADYLRQVRPSHAGPHALWPRPKNEDDEAPRAQPEIWSQNDDWRAWTWECRTGEKFSTGSQLHRWSCSSPLFERIVAYSERVTNRAEQDWLVELFGKYIEGGVSALVRDLRTEQEGHS